MIGEAHHYGVTVSDIEESLAFYRDLLDLEVTMRIDAGGDRFDRFVGVDGTDVDIVFLDAGGCAIELLEYREPPGGDANAGVSNNDVGAAHFCLEVDGIEEIHDRLTDAGVEFIAPPQTLDSGSTVCYALDPDGNVLELLDR